jgi:membrane protease YdiL (CAAX protease family)
MDERNEPLAEQLAPTEATSSLAVDPRPSPVFFGANGVRAGWRMLMFLAILSILFSGAAMVLRALSHRVHLGGGLTPWAAFLGEGIPFVIVLLASWIMTKVEGRTLGDYGLPADNALHAKFWQGMFYGFVSISALLGAMRLAGVFHLAGLALRGPAIWRYAIEWAIVFVVVGLFEEFFFRGYALFTLTTGIGFWPAAIAMSAAFGYVHHRNPGENWVGASAAGLVGLLFCLLLRRTGDLWMPIGFHAAWDWGETYFYGVPDSGQMAVGHLFNPQISGPEWLTGGTVGPEGSYLAIALLVVLYAIFAICLRGVKYPNPASVAKPDAGGSRNGPPAYALPNSSGITQG